MKALASPRPQSPQHQQHQPSAACGKELAAPGAQGGKQLAANAPLTRHASRQQTQKQRRRVDSSGVAAVHAVDNEVGTARAASETNQLLLAKVRAGVCVYRTSAALHLKFNSHLPIALLLSQHTGLTTADQISSLTRLSRLVCALTP